jgi:hypothetical protein
MEYLHLFYKPSNFYVKMNATPSFCKCVHYITCKLCFYTIICDVSTMFMSTFFPHLIKIYYVNSLTSHQNGWKYKMLQKCMKISRILDMLNMLNIALKGDWYLKLNS